jgi:hypothetical protein
MIKEIIERMIVEKAKNLSFEELVIDFELSKINTVCLKWTPGSRQKQAEFKLVTRRLFMQPPAAAL